MPERPVRDYTAPVVAALALDLDLEEARRRLRESGRDALPILDAGHVVGILTEGELDAALERDRSGLLRDRLGLRVVYCFADSNLAEAEATMRAAAVSHLAVLGEDARFLGLLARGDLPGGRRRPAPPGLPAQGTLSSGCGYRNV